MRPAGARAAPLLAGLVTLLLLPATAGAHAGLVRSDPAAGATLGASPSSVRLTFSERPQASLSTVVVSGASGGARQTTPPGAVPGDPLTLTVSVPRLPTGIYSVEYRVVSAVDGHASAGSFAFGVRRSPAGSALRPTTAAASVSGLEIAARWVLLIGLTLLIGAGAAAAARFDGGAALRVAATGWTTAVAGLVLLTVAQRRTAGSSLPDLLDTSIGRALAWRAVALAVTGVALLAAWRRPSWRRPALTAAGVAALAAVAVHAAAGHAAAGAWSTTLTVAVQVTHVAAAGVWFGGLAALLLGVRGSPSPGTAVRVRRFSGLALWAIVLLVLTGAVRAIDELSSVGELWDTGYGRAILVKIVLVAGIVLLGRRHRRRSVPAAAADLRPLRHTARLDLVLGLGALAAAAVLGTLAPPPPAAQGAPAGIDARGSDFAGTVRARLTAPSADPGPNRFTLTLRDDDDGAVRARDVVLRFTPLDDPSTAPTSLRLRPTPTAGTYAGEGADLAFPGRWRVAVEAGGPQGAISVPMQVGIRGPEQTVSALRVPGRPPEYTVLVPDLAQVRVSPHPERPGRSLLVVTVFDIFGGILPVSLPVVTTQHDADAPRQLAVRPVAGGRYAAAANLQAGPVTVVVTTRATSDGSRVRGVFPLRIPRG